MRPTDLHGVICASVTPLTPGYGIDVPRLAAHTGRLLAQGCSFISSFGTTGEGASLSTAAKLAALRALKAAGGEVQRHIPALMTPVLDEAAAMLSGLAELGCRAVLVLPPFYYKADEVGLADWFDALVARTPDTTIDLLVYNIPQVSGVRIAPGLVRLLIERLGPRLVGIKDSTGDLAGGLDFVRSFPNLAIFTGDDRVLPKLTVAGGAGMIGGMPNLFAAELVELYRNPENVGLLERQADRIAAVDRGGSLVALKAMLAHAKADEAYALVCPPLRSPDAATRATLVAALAA